MRSIVVIFAVGSAAMGAGLILCGPARFTAPALAAAREVPGGCYTWGVLILAFGLAAVGSTVLGWRRRLLVASSYLQASWFVFFDLSVIIACERDPHVPITGPVIYTVTAAVAVVLTAVGHQLKDLPR